MNKNPELFFRIKKVPKDHPTDQWDGFQIEVAKHENGKWKKFNYKTPDIKQVAISRIEMLMTDPNIAIQETV